MSKKSKMKLKDEIRIIEKSTAFIKQICKDLGSDYAKNIGAEQGKRKGAK